MTTDGNKAIVREFMERAFNQGDLSIMEPMHTSGAVDHQESPGTPFVPHLKQVISGMRAVFPDLHFEIHEMIAEGNTVAFRSTMTGTHTGSAPLEPWNKLPPTGKHVSVAHMHFVRLVDGRTTDLWHVWDTAGMMRQLGIAPAPQP